MRDLVSQLLAVGPELVAFILAAPMLAASVATAQSIQAAAPSPNLDLSQLGRVAIGGDFDSISLYNFQGQNENLSSNGSQSLLTTYNGTFTSLGLVDADSTIVAMCPFIAKDGTDQGVIVAGNFTSLDGVAASSIALWNPTDGSVTALPGLSGTVHALYCDRDSTTVYVGGSFMAGNSANAMAWTTGWMNLPFAGFNGPVNAITKNSAGNIVFGGDFNGLGNATTPNKLDAQVVNLSGGDISSDGTTDTAEYSDPRSIICSTPNSESNWLLADDTTGWWGATFGFGFNPTKLRLYNANVEGRGTKTWYFRRLDDGGILNFTYVDPTSGQLSSCSSVCPLPENNGTAQDFRFVNPVGTSKFQIWITDWYGSGGGLSGIELFQDDIYSYAVNDFNEPKCDGVTNGSTSIATPNTTWTRVPNNGLTQADFLSATLTDPSQLSSDTSIVFKPNLQQSGNYTITVFTTGCILDNSCATRGIVNLTSSVTSGGDPITTTLYQTNNNDKSDQIYYGYVDADSDSFAPSVTLTPAAGQSVPLTVVAARVRFELINSTTGGLNGIFEYNPDQVIIDTDFTKSAIDSAGASLDSRAVFNAMVEYKDTIYAAGDFSGNGVSNIMAITDNMTALPGGGLDGQVLGMRLDDSNLYIGGTFQNTPDKSVDGLSNIAVFSISDNKWSALGAGVDGAVFDVVPLRLNITTDDVEDCFAVSGNFSNVNAFSGNDAFAVDGFAVWIPSQDNWLNNIPNATVALEGFFTAYTEVPDRTPLYGGLVKSQGFDYTGAVELVGSGEPSLQTLGIRLQASSSDSTSSSTRKRALDSGDDGQNFTGIYDGLFYSDNGLNITILGGNFAATASNGSTVHNLAFINNTNSAQTISGTDGIDADSVFVTMDTFGTALYAGGAVNGTVNGNGATGLVVYDLSRNSFANPHPPALGGDMVVVNAIARQPDSTFVYVGGQFDTAGSLPCSTLCAYDAGVMQWQNTGTGLSGQITAMLWASKTQLIITGNLTVNGNATFMATYDSKKTTFEEFSGASTLPGPIMTISAIDSSYDEFWVAGVATSNSSVFLSKYAGGTWTGAGGLGSNTVIRKLQIMPVTSNHHNSDLVAENQVLMILGNVVIPDQGNASAVLFNGTTYEPYILTTSQNGSEGSLSAIFVSNPENFMENTKHHLALGWIVFIGLAIALILIGLMVVAGMLLERRRKRQEGYVPMRSIDKSTNITRLPPETLFSNLEGKSNPPKI